MSFPDAVQINPINGNIYMADRNNERVQIFNSSGVYQEQFGSEGTGKGQFAGNAGPVDVFLTDDGFLYVVDRNNHRVQKFTDNSLLPVELLSFKVRVQKPEWVQLEWITASESNNDFFTIERSRDGQNWRALTQINGAGDRLIAQSYTHVDYVPSAGVYYYRLKQTDFDGTFDYMGVRSVTMAGAQKEGLWVYPNPAQTEITIQSEAEPLRDWQLLNAFGQEVSNQVDLLHQSDQLLNINVARLTAGVYYLITSTTSKKILIAGTR